MYRKKPKRVEAYRFNKADPPPMVELCYIRGAYVRDYHGSILHVTEGEFIVADPKGGWKVMSEYDFLEKYEMERSS